MNRHEPVGQQLRSGKYHVQVTKMVGKQDNPESLEGLIKDLYQIKKEILDIPKHTHATEKRELTSRKDELIFTIQKELKKVSKQKADKIRKRLWEELGVMV